jgi:hypothetical protein
MSAASASILVSGAPAAIFEDDFSGGDLSAWTSVTRLTIDGAQGSPAAPSARANVTAQSAFAYRDLAGPVTGQVCMSLNVNLASGTGVDLFRLRSAGNGALIKVFVAANGTIQIRSDFASSTRTTTIQFGTGWHSVELCGTVGTASTWDLYRDGVLIVNDWSVSTGTAGVTRVQIGDSAAKTFTANFDQIRLDQLPG